MGTPESTAAPTTRAPWLRLFFRAVAVATARARFLLLVGGLLGLIAAWPYLQNYWAKLNRTAPIAGAISPDTEYWCPMCPGVVSEWPSKCPVCNMTLVRRQKGDMTPLPDGVVARVQLSPYRLQLAGIRTVTIDYVRLEYEIITAGILEADASSNNVSSLTLTATVFERDAAMLTPGQEGQVSCDSCPGQLFGGRVEQILPAQGPAMGRRVKLRVNNLQGELGPGQFAMVRFHTAVTRLDSSRRYELVRWRDDLAASLLRSATSNASLESLLDAGARHAAALVGYTLAVPESAVIDTGARQVVYRESMPGVFDAVEVRLGRRCGEFYPVLSGLEWNQRVATAGAVLLDAETRLNPNVAASYFGSASRTRTQTQTASPAVTPMSASEDRQLIARQKICPVTGEDLDSMGGPVKVVVDSKIVFICCKGCEKSLRSTPEKYLTKLAK